ncbi:MAG: acetylxylan esterase [Armatimonadetes bacterium]|nr:acetylxylan esterase [Armatimonadota bacterium]
MFLSAALPGAGRNSSARKGDQHMWDLQKLFQAPRVCRAEGFSEAGLRAIFYEGLPFRGKPTQVFAWLGLPRVRPGERVPGMVLVHGGGGTAFAEWVRLWVSRGYAAIAMDTCGCVPRGRYGAWERHELGGPPGWGGFDQIDWPREDQWTYHAVADAVLANSLLRSLPQVDPDRIGLTGISWGGWLACIVAGVDHRLRLVVPVYGCGFTLDTVFGDAIRALGQERSERWLSWWEPALYLPNARMPMLWVNGTNDFAYTLDAYQKSYRLPKGPRTLCIRLRMPHGHGGPGEKPEEIRVFADSILKGGTPLPRIIGWGRHGSEVWAKYESSVPVVKAELLVTRDTGKWQDRNWEAVPATLESGGRVRAVLPEDTAVWFINIEDNRGCVASTEHEEVRR